MASSNERALTRLAIAVAILAIAVGAGRWWWARRSLPSDMSRGGIELTYDVDLARPVDHKFELALDELVSGLRSHAAAPTAVAPEARSALLSGVTAGQVKPLAGDLVVEAAADGRTRVSLSPERARQIEEYALQQQARTVYQRIEKLRWCVPTVEQLGTRLKVGLPGLTAERAERVKGILGMGGLLEFRELDAGEALARIELPPGVTHQSDDWNQRDTGRRMHAEVLEADDRAVLDLLRKRLVLPGGVEALLERREKLDGDAARPIWRLELVKRGAEVTGDMVDDATASTDKMSMRPVVNLVFSEQGGRRFADLSERLIGKKLAIVVDGQVMSAPVVESRIAGGRAMITLGGTKPPEQQIKEAQDLAAALRGGALPAPMSLASERRIAPSK